MIENRAKTQEAFNTIVRHLLAQGVRSSQWNDVKGEEVCLYRGPNGLKCAAGCLIPDEAYEVNMEGLRASKVAHEWDLFEGMDMLLLNRCQQIHDAIPPTSWRTELQEASSEYGLEWPSDL